MAKIKTAVVVVIGCELNAATHRIPLFRDEDLESVVKELTNFKTGSYEDLDQRLIDSEISVFGHKDLINQFVNKLTAGES